PTLEKLRGKSAQFFHRPWRGTDCSETTSDSGGGWGGRRYIRHIPEGSPVAVRKRGTVSATPTIYHPSEIASNCIVLASGCESKYLCSTSSKRLPASETWANSVALDLSFMSSGE